MAAKKKSMTNDELIQNNVLESSENDNHKIELISSTDPNLTTISTDLQSEIDLFESELDESNEIVSSVSIVEKEIENIESEKAENLDHDKTEVKKPTKVETTELEKPETIITLKEEKPKTKAKKTRKSKTTDVNEKSKEEPEIKKSSKKAKTKKTKKSDPKEKESETVEMKEPEIINKKESEVENLKKPAKSEKGNNSEESQNVPEKKNLSEEIIDIKSITESIIDPEIQTSVLAIYNENAELKANLEKAKKIMRILKKKLDLAEEKEEQWRICANNLGDIFAEKSHMPLEDVLRRFEAPLDDVSM